MANSTHRQTAKIYQFPSRPELAKSRRRNAVAEQRAPVPNYADCASGGAWYHEEAIAQRDTSPKLTPGRR